MKSVRDFRRLGLLDERRATGPVHVRGGHRLFRRQRGQGVQPTRQHLGARNRLTRRIRTLGDDSFGEGEGDRGRGREGGDSRRESHTRQINTYCIRHTCEKSRCVLSSWCELHASARARERGARGSERETTQFMTADYFVIGTLEPAAIFATAQVASSVI